jgi:hypothetical protein
MRIGTGLPDVTTMWNDGGTLAFSPIEWSESQSCHPALRDIPLGPSQFLDTGSYVLEPRKLSFTFRATDAEKDTLIEIFNESEEITITLCSDFGTWLYVGWIEDKNITFEYVIQDAGVNVRWWKINMKVVVENISYNPV